MWEIVYIKLFLFSTQEVGSNRPPYQSARPVTCLSILEFKKSDFRTFEARAEKALLPGSLMLGVGRLTLSLQAVREQRPHAEAMHGCCGNQPWVLEI